MKDVITRRPHNGLRASYNHGLSFIHGLVDAIRNKFSDRITNGLANQIMSIYKNNLFYKTSP